MIRQYIHKTNYGDQPIPSQPSSAQLSPAYVSPVKSSPVESGPVQFNPVQYYDMAEDRTDWGYFQLDMNRKASWYGGVGFAMLAQVSV